MHSASIAILTGERNFSAAVSAEPFRVHRERVIVSCHGGGHVVGLNFMNFDQPMFESDYRADDDESNHGCCGYG